MPCRPQTSARPLRLTVLLVEDEPMLSEIVGQLLDGAGYRHVTIADHDQIAGAVERWHPHCVILGSEPPAQGKGRSWADAAAIRRAHPELPVLMFTADTDSMAEARAGTSVRGNAAGFAGVMDKPFLVTEFLATPRHAVEAPQEEHGRPTGKRVHAGLAACRSGAGGGAALGVSARHATSDNRPLGASLTDTPAGLRGGGAAGIGPIATAAPARSYGRRPASGRRALRNRHDAPADSHDHSSLGLAGYEDGRGGVVATQPEATATRERSTKPWVLLVEDEPTLSKLVGKLLDEAGYEHASIADHDEISAAVVRWQPRCVILDSDPGSAGHERSWADAAAIRRAHPDLPVLMFTADPASMAEARSGTTPRSKAAGYAGVIDKPFLVVEFLATLKHAVDTQSATRHDGKGLASEAISMFPDLAGPASASWDVADFFSMAVHELRTPLTSIDGHAQLAQRFLTKDPARSADSLARIREQSKRMNRLIGDLLDQARVSVGALSLEVATFDLGVATAITIGLHEHEDPPRITFTTSTPSRVQGDPERIAQVLGNLLDNALKYSAPGSAVDVSLTVVGNEAQIRVTDRGVGVPDDERDRIFAPFYRTSRTRDIPGTGLGLHISRRIAEQHHGRLWLESTSSAGTSFVLALPLAQGPTVRS